MHIDIQRDHARTMRKNMTGAERKLWTALRGRSLSGFRFNRQVEIGPYIVDFLCREIRIIVEVDGVTHGDAHECWQTSDVRNIWRRKAMWCSASGTMTSTKIWTAC